RTVRSLDRGWPRMLWSTTKTSSRFPAPPPLGYDPGVRWDSSMERFNPGRSLMKTRPGVHGRTRALQITSRQRGVLILALLFTTAIGCGVQRAKEESAATQPVGDSKTTTAAAV